jgi:hypothetical protein
MPGGNIGAEVAIFEQGARHVGKVGGPPGDGEGRRVAGGVQTAPEEASWPGQLHDPPMMQPRASACTPVLPPSAAHNPKPR